VLPAHRTRVTLTHSPQNAQNAGLSSRKTTTTSSALSVNASVLPIHLDAPTTTISNSWTTLPLRTVRHTPSPKSNNWLFGSSWTRTFDKGQKPLCIEHPYRYQLYTRSTRNVRAISRASRMQRKTNGMQRQRNGMQDNGMECKTRQDRCSVSSLSNCRCGIELLTVLGESPRLNGRMD